MKACTAQRKLSDCSECSEEACPHSKARDHMRTGALKAGLFVKTQPGDSALLIEGWTKELVDQFPSCLLFLPEQANLSQHD